MWLQPSPWPDTTKLSSGENGRKSCLTEGHAVRYAQKQAKRLFFGNVTAFLSLSGLVGRDTATFSGFRVPSRAPLSSRRPQNGKTAA